MSAGWPGVTAAESGQLGGQQTQPTDHRPGGQSVGVKSTGEISGSPWACPRGPVTEWGLFFRENEDKHERVQPGSQKRKMSWMWGDGEEKTRRRSLPGGGNTWELRCPLLSSVPLRRHPSPSAHDTKGFSGARSPLPAPSCLVRPPRDKGPQ